MGKDSNKDSNKVVEGLTPFVTGTNWFIYVVLMIAAVALCYMIFAVLAAGNENMLRSGIFVGGVVVIIGSVFMIYYAFDKEDEDLPIKGNYLKTNYIRIGKSDRLLGWIVGLVVNIIMLIVLLVSLIEVERDGDIRWILFIFCWIIIWAVIDTITRPL